MILRGAFFILWAGALAAASSFDLSLSTAMAQPEHLFAQIIYHHGTWPSGLLYLAGVIWLAVPSLRRRSELVSLLAAVVLAHALIHPLLLTTLIKISFGRLRFHQLGPGGAGFTPFYLPQPQLGGRSFPSGHVATSVVLCPAILVAWRRGSRRLAAVLTLVTVSWGLAVAYGRILHGAHYLTDGIFSLGLSPLLSPHTAQAGAWYRTKFDPKEDQGS